MELAQPSDADLLTRVAGATSPNASPSGSSSRAWSSSQSHS